MMNRATVLALGAVTAILFLLRPLRCQTCGRLLPRFRRSHRVSRMAWGGFSAGCPSYRSGDQPPLVLTNYEIALGAIGTGFLLVALSVPAGLAGWFHNSPVDFNIYAWSLGIVDGTPLKLGTILFFKILCVSLVVVGAVVTALAIARMPIEVIVGSAIVQRFLLKQRERGWDEVNRLESSEEWEFMNLRLPLLTHIPRKRRVVRFHMRDGPEIAMPVSAYQESALKALAAERLPSAGLRRHD